MLVVLQDLERARKERLRGLRFNVCRRARETAS